MPLVADVAGAITSELNAHEFSAEFDAERKYLPLFELPEMKTLHVTVVPKGVTMETRQRNAVQHDVQVDVAVQKKLESEDNAEVDTLMALVEEIADFFRLRRLTQFPTAVWVGTENSPVYSQEHLSEMRQFTSVLTLTFRVVR